jgi:hypothetical protein
MKMAEVNKDTYDKGALRTKHHEFLSPEWLAAVETLEGQPELQADDPVVNIIVPDSPFGAVKVNIWGTRFGAGHRPEADATATMPYKYARGAFIESTPYVAMMYNVIHPCILGQIQVEGDYNMWVMIMNGLNRMLDDIRQALFQITTPAPHGLLGPVANERGRINADIERLGLWRHVRELGEQGYTVVTPDQSGVTTEMMDRALSNILEREYQRTGVRPDTETGSTHSDVFYPVLWYSLFKDKVFQEMAANEHAMTLASQLFNTTDIRFSQDDVLMKGPAKNLWGQQQLGLHVDAIPYGFSQEEPLPEQNISCNALWLLTDFSDVSDGVTVFIPGSQNYRRWPKKGVESQEYYVPIIAPRGSFLLWPGTTWHGALPRTRPGLRVAMTMQYCQPYAQRRMPYQLDVTEEILAQNPPRFAKLMGLTDMSGWREEGVYGRMHALAQRGAQRYLAGKADSSVMSLNSVLYTRKKTKKAA